MAEAYLNIQFDATGDVMRPIRAGVFNVPGPHVPGSSDDQPWMLAIRAQGATPEEAAGEYMKFSSEE
jgi:hypothetical protein